MIGRKRDREGTKRAGEVDRKQSRAGRIVDALVLAAIVVIGLAAIRLFWK